MIADFQRVKEGTARHHAAQILQVAKAAILLVYIRFPQFSHQLPQFRKVPDAERERLVQALFKPYNRSRRASADR